MAGPPFNYDTSNPSATSAIAAFPANEQTFRSTVSSAVGVVVDPTTGLGPIVGRYTTTQKNALVNPPTGLIVYDTTLGASTGFQINTGTPASPVWTSI